MENYCAFSKNHKCILWTDYEITREELSECHTLCHGNWIEIGKRQTMRQSLKSTPPIIGDVASCIRPEDYLTMA